jgi:hypothetical protein
MRPPESAVFHYAETPARLPTRLRGLIEDIVSKVFAVEPEQLRRATRGRARIALARQVAMYIAHVGYGLSLTEVGRLFERDRTTVAHACGVVEIRREDPDFDEAVVLLELIVRAVEGSCALGETGTFSALSVAS